MAASIAHEHTALFLQHDENASENCKNLFFTPPSADRSCVTDAANRFLQATWITVRESAPLPTSARKSLATSASSKRSRFLVNTVASHTASSKFSPTNQRNKML